ncbi:MAG: DNA-directed RNA polymerase subunit beta' [Verrucomicrobiales bacterium]
MSTHPQPEDIIGIEKPVQGFDQVSIRVAAPDTIRKWSSGEVINPETINYRTFKPEKGGLFCERIFGPTKDWQCACGKYKNIKHKGVICDRCGVEVTLARVRRERMGHIELAVPVTHIWFYKCMPSRLGLMLDMTARQLERVIYYEDFIVIDPGDTQLTAGQLLTEPEMREAEDAYGADAFRAGMGAEALRDLLARVNLAEVAVQLEQDMLKTKSKQNRKKLAKRLKLAKGFAESHSRPEWMVLEVLPVIPPDLRPLVPLEGGRFATSDLNDLYRRVINRNNRLKNLLMLKTPDVIIRNEKRMLQESVDALFDNGRHGRAVTGAGNRPLKSLSDMLKGKGGRFRQNLLGKRVDYSGRSVIVIGPELKLHQCGLPKKMALVLFEPFIIRRLKELGFVHTVRSAKKMIERRTPEVWDILEEVTKGHPVLLNRAPTLHRLSIQAFEPVLIEGEAIRVHPLVCTAYNADFDGDQMAVHVPLSVEAQMEARLLMLAPNNIFSPANGKPITTPSQDIVLGCYYLTHERPMRPDEKEAFEKGELHMPIFENTTEVEFAIASRKIWYHDRIRLRNPDFGKTSHFGDKEKRVIVTTPGRVRFNEIWPKGLGFINKTVGKKQLSEIIWGCFQVAGQRETVRILDDMKNLGFKEATRSGCSIGIVDMVVPDEKPDELKKAYDQLSVVDKQRRAGVITEGERYNKIVDIWTQATQRLETSVMRKLEHNQGAKTVSPLWMMVDSGARGNKTQIKQLSGMRGLMSKPDGSIIERPITSNFREGLTVLEYFISTHGARKGLSDTALKTADSGYMTRKLVDVSQDVIVTEIDCGTVNGIIARSIYEGDDEVVSLKQRIYGRTSGETVKDPVSGEIIVREGDIITEAQAFQLTNLGVEQLKIRSVLTCESQRGCCIKCYGLNLATGRPVKIGEAVGIIAAQSIGEPGTQLTMRTFHVGGTASSTFKQPIVQVKNVGSLRFNDIRTVANEEGKLVALNKNGTLALVDDEGEEIENYNVVLGSVLHFPDNAKVKKGDTVLTWDPYNVPIITERGGKVTFVDMIRGVTISRDNTAEAEAGGLVVMEHKGDLHPQIVIIDPSTKEQLASYSIPAGAHLSVKEGQKVGPGAQLARTPRKASKTKDITGGLPRVAELFEARKPKDACVIARIDGFVEIGGLVRGKKKVLVHNKETGEEAEHLVPANKHIIVANGDFVKRGSQLTEGPVVPHEILEISGANALQQHLTNEVQEVYRLQGVEINDKHIEIIIRQMLRKVRITDPGDTEFLWGDQVERIEFERVNRETTEEGGQPAQAEPVLLGITKASLETESFISAASFQDTTRVLTEAATHGKIDKLEGFKENVIMGHLIPAGSGFPNARDTRVQELETVAALEAHHAAAAEPESDAIGDL